MGVSNMSVEFLTTEAYPPRDFEVGRIQGVTEMNPEAFGLYSGSIPAQIVKCDIYNPNIAYMNATHPGRYEQIRRQEGVMNAFSAANYRNWGHQRKAKIVYEQDPEHTPETDMLHADESTAYGDPTARRRFFGNGGVVGDPALQLWRSMIPQASALLPLVNPYNTSVVRDPRTGQERPMSLAAQEWMAACTDGQEIFHRNAIMIEEMGGFLGKYAATHPNQKMTVLSIAGGTALGTMQAIMRSGVDPANVQLVLAEGDEHSAKMAFDLAGRIGYTGTITHKKMDIFSPKAMQALKAELDQSEAKVVALDGVGIAEYSNRQLRTKALERRYGEDYMLYDPEAFIQTCLSLVDNEGMAIVGQMRTDRINPHFTRGVVSWPTICMRSVRSFTHLLQKGGAHMNLTKLSLTPLDTYTMATMYKSEQAAHIAGFQIGNHEAKEATDPLWMRVMQTAGCVGSAATRPVVK